MDCLFCRMIRGEIPTKKVYENEDVFVFEDIKPQAPTHVLIVPKKHIAGLREAQADPRRELLAGDAGGLAGGVDEDELGLLAGEADLDVAGG